MKLEKINPLLYITDRDPIPEEVKETSKWFTTETLEIDVGEYVGRPHAASLFHTSFIMPLIADGWYITQVKKNTEEGEWVSTATATASQSSTGQSTSEAKSETKSSASSKATSRSPVSTAGFVSDTGSSEGTSTGTSSGVSTGRGVSSTEGQSSTETSQDGGPWWCAYVSVRLVRRRLNGELVLKDMIESFTVAYNEGREINDERYDELVALYALMLSRTEDEANAFASLSTDDFKPLADAIIASCRDALEKYGASVDDIPEDWLQSRIDAINRKFDALVAQTKSDMVSKGTYNSTVWPTTESGIERDRQLALNDLKDDMVTLKVETLGKIASLKADIGQKLLDCEIRIIEAQQKMLLGPTEVRNTVFKWMLDFMERRDDEYPGLEQIATIASQLGYADRGVPIKTNGE